MSPFAITTHRREISFETGNTVPLGRFLIMDAPWMTFALDFDMTQSES